MTEPTDALRLLRERITAWHDAVHAYADGLGTVGALMKCGADLADVIAAVLPVLAQQQQLVEAEEQCESHRQSMAAILHANDALCRELQEAEATRRSLEAFVRDVAALSLLTTASEYDLIKRARSLLTAAADPERARTP